MPGMFDIFTNTNPAQPAAQPAATQQAAPVAPVATPGNIPDAASPDAQPAQPAPAVPAVAEPTVPDSPLAEFQKLWEDAPVDPNKPAPTTPIPLDAAAVQKAVAKTNFSQGITPETMAAIVAGGEGAQTAMMEALNQTAQQVMVQSTMVNEKLTQKAIKEALASQQTIMQEQVRSQVVADHLKTTNPLFSDPAVKPVIEATQQQLMVKFPNATPAEITDMTQNYITAMGAAFAPTEVVNDNLGQSQTDWTKFIE